MLAVVQNEKISSPGRMPDKQAVFLDKDGTLVEDFPYNVDPALTVMVPGAIPGLKVLDNLGFALFIITNQPALAYGYGKRADLDAVKNSLNDTLGRGGIRLKGFYFCPHAPDGQVRYYRKNCDCRKPKPGLLLKAARDHDIDLRRSWMVGDILDDVEAGNRAGCKTVLINNGNETEWRLSALRIPRYVARSLGEAVTIIAAATAPGADAPAGKSNGSRVTVGAKKLSPVLRLPG